MRLELDSELLRTFIAIVDTGTFTKAADVVNLTQSAVSMQMKRLDEITNKEMFTRDGRKVRLSRHGEILQRYARSILKMHDEALSVLREDDFKGQVTLGIPDDYVDNFLPSFFQSFNRKYPLVELNVICQESSILEVMLEQNKLDLAIMSRHPQSLSSNEIPLRNESLVWVTSKHNIAHEKTPLPLAMFGESCMFRRWAIEALENINRTHRIAYSSQNLAGILAYVRTGAGISMLAESSVTSEFKILGEKDGFPALPEITLVFSRAPANTSTLIDHVESYIMQSFNQPQVNIK